MLGTMLQLTFSTVLVLLMGLDVISCLELCGNSLFQQYSFIMGLDDLGVDLHLWLLIHLNMTVVVSRLFSS